MMTTDPPLLSILIATLASRRQKLLKLLAVLVPQAERCSEPVEVIALYNNGESPIGVLRQQLLDIAEGTFVCFVDDDDMVAADYVGSLAAMLRLHGFPSAARNLDSEPEFHGFPIDTVGFKVHLSFANQMSICSRRQYKAAVPAGRPQIPMAKIAEEPQTRLWYHDWGIMIPTRTTLARRCRFDTYRGPVGEDGWFKQQLLPLLGAEVYMNAVLYDYRYDPADSSQTGRRPGGYQPRPVIRSPRFRWHPRSIR
jgi:hypothetical protein